MKNIYILFMELKFSLFSENFYCLCEPKAKFAQLVEFLLLHKQEINSVVYILYRSSCTTVKFDMYIYTSI